MRFNTDYARFDVERCCWRKKSSRILQSFSLSRFPFVVCLTMKTGTVVSLNFGNYDYVTVPTT